MSQPESATIFCKVAHCSRCNTGPLSSQEIQNGWLCYACANGATGPKSDTPRIVITDMAPACAKCGGPGVVAVRTDLGWEGRCRRDGDCESAVLAANVAAQCDHQAIADGCLACAAALDRTTARASMMESLKLLADAGSYADATAAQLRERFHLPPSPRPDGFSQSAIDAAKAVLLSTVAKRWKR